MDDTTNQSEGKSLHDTETQAQDITLSQQKVEGSPEDSQVSNQKSDMKRRMNKSDEDKLHMPVDEDTAAAKEQSYRYDVVLWLFGILFMFVLHSLIFGLGTAQGWDAPSPYYHNMSNSSMDRFLPEPWIPEPGVYKRSDKEASSRWYYWKLKPEDVTVWTKLFVWAGYSLHNLSVWLVLYLQHKAKSFPDINGKYGTKFSNNPDKYNIIMFALNVFFHLLHLLNTHTTYDGTAADTSEASSQSSVIVALIVMIFIEFKDRGVFFGYPSPYQLRNYQDSIWMSPVYIMRKYHGYFIYWAAIFTFWYHPMENTVGHVFGFTHTWFFMLQGSLAFTKLHLNRYWRFTLEVWVTIHSGVIAVQTVPNIMGKELWPMFVFGFATAIILTQAYGLPFWRNIPAWTRVVPVSIFAVIVVTAYSYIRDVQGRRFTRISEIIRIPGIYYLILAIGWLVIVAVTKLQRVYSSKTVHSTNSSSTGISNDTKLTAVEKPPRWKEVVFVSGAVFTYCISVFLSWILEYLDMQVNLIVLTMIYCFSFMLISAIAGSYFLSGVIPLRRYKVTAS